jgi:CRP/FNR family transcriptional regulator, dissimilatory nitrate respiration regulator
MLQLLTDCNLFKGMTEEEKRASLQLFNYQIKKYSRNEVIVYSGDNVTQQLILLVGSVKNEMSDYNGKIIKITDLDAPKLLAPGFLFGNNSNYPVSIFAKTDCEIMAISKHFFLESILKNKQLQINFLNLISNQTQFLTRKINFLKLKSIKAKIAHFLLNQYLRQKKQTILLPQSQTQMADLFGVTRPSLSRSMNELCHDSVISIKGKQVTIINIDSLKSYLY